jgi:bifunctional enzyme CysN/CysC
MEWFEGASLLDILQNMECNIQDTNTLRFPIQYINRPDSSFRGYVGTIASGKLNVGDKIKITPSNKITTIKEIITFDNNLQSASKDEAITVTFDDQIDVSRGDIITLADDKSKLSSSFDTTIIWMDDEPYDSSKQYQLKIHTLNTNAKITINSIKDLNSTQDISSARININDIAFCSIELDKEVLLNTFDTNKITGSFILINPYTNKTSATGVITKLHQKNRNIFVQEHTITKELRVKNIEQKPMIIWLTGLSASGKSTIANELEKQLYAKGYKTYLLDGDNLRNGLNSDLGFSQEDRKENIRRVAHVASLMLDAGLIVITAFISPFLEDRAYARSLVKEDEFIEVFIDTPLEVCEKRDTKGLYKKAKDGIIKDFTGISSPYEKPINAELVLNNIDIEKSVQEILYFIESKS